MNVNTIFFGSRQPGTIILKSILPLPYLNIQAVITKPDRKSNGPKNTPNQLRALAKGKHLSLIKPPKISPAVVAHIKKLNPQLGILASYGEIIPRSLLDLFSRGIINIHPSLLPRHRGPSPVATAILRGDKETGVSLMLLDEKLDHGPLIAQKTIPVPPITTTNRQKLTKKLFQEGGRLLHEKLPDYLNGSITPQPQNHSQATFTKTLKRKDGFISFAKLTTAVCEGNEGEKILQKIAALSPWPGVYSLFPNIKKSYDKPVRVKILAAHQESNNLRLDRVHFAGKTPIDWNKNLQKIYFSGQ